MLLKNKQSRASKLKRQRLVWGAVVIVSIFLLGGLLTRRQHVGQTLSLATTRQPEPLTELYFTNHRDLPKKFARKQALPFQFSIHNLEGKSVVYLYQVVVHAQSTTESPVQEVAVADKDTATITQSAIITDGSAQAEVELRLVNKNQSVHFWTEREK